MKYDVVEVKGMCDYKNVDAVFPLGAIVIAHDMDWNNKDKKWPITFTVLVPSKGSDEQKS